MPVENSFEEGEQYHRYLITPEAMFKAEKQARQKRLDVLGVYHTHPDEEARPSLYDRDRRGLDGLELHYSVGKTGQGGGSARLAPCTRTAAGLTRLRFRR